MKYEISLSEDDTYVRIRVFEAITGEMEKNFAGEAIKEAKQRGLSRFLVDVRGTPNVASTFQQYLFGYEDMDEFGLPRGSRIAVLTDAGDRTHDFIETVLVNAGYNCRLFREEEAALNWLLVKT